MSGLEDETRIDVTGLAGYEPDEAEVLDPEVLGPVDAADEIAKIVRPVLWAVEAQNSPAPTLPLALNPGKTEMSVADEFVRRYSPQFRWVEDRGAWYGFDGVRWRASRTLVYDCIKAIVRSAEIAQKHCTVSAVEHLARVDSRCALEYSALDADPWLLCTPEGTVDLRTGELRESAREELCSKSTTVAPAPEGTLAPLWTKFLGEATCGDGDLQAYLRRVAGYCLTGSVREHALFFAYGRGGNGKGVFIDTLLTIFGDYGHVAPDSLFTEQKHERHETEIAGLAGRRLAVGQEIDQGKAWAGAKVKKLTGGDQLTGRFMRQDFFRFAATHKLLIAANAKPKLHEVAAAERRRFHVIPFDAAPRTPDVRLGEKLLAEAPAILRWAIDGCLEWQRIGLAPPKIVTDATKSYLDGEDLFGDFFAEHFEVDPEGFVRSSDIWRLWETFCEAQHEEPGSLRVLMQKLAARGYPLTKRSGQRGAKGLRRRLSEGYQGNGLGNEPIT